MDTDELNGLLASWTRALRAQRKSDETVKSYTTGVVRFLAWCEEEDTPPLLDRPTVNAWVVDLLASGLQPSSARARQLGVRRFSAWLADEGEIPTDQLLGIKSIKLDQKIVPALTDDQVLALLDACRGSDMQDVRDRAILLVMVSTGIRAGECVNLATSDVDLDSKKLIVRRGKGGKGRAMYLPDEAVEAVDRYLRRGRKNHARASSPDLWLGERKKGFSYDALHKTLRKRATSAGLEGFHPHLLRHTFATRWLGDGLSEGGLMASAGWTRRDMIDRYTRATASDRAMEEARSRDVSRR